MVPVYATLNQKWERKKPSRKICSNIAFNVICVRCTAQIQMYL